MALTGLQSGNASAATTTWHLNNAVLTSGATVTGSFIFDSTAGSYTSIDVAAGATHFGIPDPASPGNENVLIAVDGPHSNYTATPLLAMNWSSALTPAGGTVNLNTAGFSFLGTCGDATCGSVGSATSFVSGSVTTAETWYLQNAVLTNGLAVTGSFAFDPVVGTYSNINIQAGGTLFGIPNPRSSGNSTVLIAVDGLHSDYTGTPTIAMNWAGALTPAGGTVNLNTAGFSFLGTCADAVCGSNAVIASFASGFVTTTAPVPEPGTWALLLAGLFGVSRLARTPAARHRQAQ
jgi:hypothetical protein